MNEMVERVKAALLAEWAKGNSAKPFQDDDPTTDYFASEVENFARAAMEALHEPLEWMILRADQKAEAVHGCGEMNLDPHTTWRVMMDTALNE